VSFSLATLSLCFTEAN